VGGAKGEVQLGVGEVAGRREQLHGGWRVGTEGVAVQDIGGSAEGSRSSEQEVSCGGRRYRNPAELG